MRNRLWIESIGVPGRQTNAGNWNHQGAGNQIRAFFTGQGMEDPEDMVGSGAAALKLLFGSAV